MITLNLSTDRKNRGEQRKRQTNVNIKFLNVEQGTGNMVVENGEF
jgi:hypothetical protein